MAEETNSEQPNPVTEDMELEATEPAQESKGDASNGETNSKRAREEGGDGDGDGDGSGEKNDGVSKKQKVEDEKSVEEERLEKKLGDEEQPARGILGPKTFGSSVEMFDYFYKFLHYWPPNLNVNMVRAFCSFVPPISVWLLRKWRRL